MPFVKVLKNKAYFKRYQVKFRRRREGKTDYYARKRLTVQHKAKYNSPKYRLVVRKTNTQIICQIVYATIQGDVTLAAATSKELKRYGLTVGLKNYSAAYCTGLLVGRRVLQKLGLDEKYTGTGNDLPEDEVTGEIMTVSEGKKKYFVDELDEDRMPFRCFLDVGLAATNIGNFVFGALKGASDAGLDIPHNHKRFPGYDPDTKEYDPSEHRDRIFGSVTQEYMTTLEEEDEEAGTELLKERFGAYVKAGVSADDLEDLYLSVHKAIREDPSPLHKENKKTRVKSMTFDNKYKNQQKISYEERKAKVAAKLAAMEEDSDSDEE